MTAIEYTPSTDPDTEIARLRLALRVERERRVMAVLWGARDEDCPRGFSLCDQAGAETHVLGYGFVWPDDVTTFRWSDGVGLFETWDHFREMTEELVTRHGGSVRVVWVSEDVADLTDAITEDVRRKYREALKSFDVRDRVAHAICAADPIESTWTDTLGMAEAALAALAELDDS